MWLKSVKAKCVYSVFQRFFAHAEQQFLHKYNNKFDRQMWLNQIKICLEFFYSSCKF